MFLSLFNTMFTVLMFSLLHYSTELHFTKYKSGFSVKLFQISKAEWTPVLINKIWYYRMHQKSSQVISEQILTLYFKCPSFSSNHLFNVAPKVQLWVMLLQSSPQPVWGWGLVALACKDQTVPQGPLYSVSKMVQNQQTSQLI